MTDFIADDLWALALLIKFMLVSTLLLGGVYLAERLGLIKTPKMSETTWLAAIAASFIALLPLPTVFEAVELPTITANSAERASAPVTIPEVTVGTEADKAQPSPAPNPPIARRVAADTGPALEKKPTLAPAVVETRSEPTPLGSIIGIVWLSLGFLALLTLAVSFRNAVKDLGSRIRVPAEHPANQRLRALCERADIRHVPYLSRSSEINSPVCLPKREICLPDWAFDDMPEEALNSLIAHELAHMLRRDPINMIVMQFITRIFFFQPLFVLARRRLEDAAELAADEWAANTTANAGAVANALYTCAKKITEKRQIQWGLAMAGDQSILKQRIARLLKAKQSAFDTTGKAAPMAVAATILLAACAAPSVEFATEEFGTGGYKSYESSHEEGSEIDSRTHTETDGDGIESGNMHWSDGNRSMKVSWEGPFTLSEDERRIESVGPEGMLKITSTVDGVKRRIRFENEEGALETRYWINGKRADFDKDQSDWLAASLKELLRHSSIDMENRVGRYLKKGGPNYAIRRGADLASDHVKRMFVISLLQQTDLNESEKNSLVTLISTVNSDYELRLLVTHMYDTGVFGDEDISEVLDIAESIDSDYELRLALASVLGRTPLGDASLKKVLKLAQSIDSDYELRLLLSMAADDTKFSQENKLLFVNAMSTIESDYEKRLLIDVFADKMANNTAITLDLLKQVAKMDSGYEKRLGLNTILSHSTMTDEAWELALTAAQSIESDYEKRLSLSTILSRISFDDLEGGRDKAWEFAIEIAQSIDSDFEKAQILTHMAAKSDGNREYLAAIKDAAEAIGSRHERENVMRALGASD